MRRLGLTLLLSAWVVSFAPSALAITAVRIRLESEPGDGIGLGQSYEIELDPSRAGFSFISTYDSSRRFVYEAYFVFGGIQTGNPDLEITFSTSQLGIPLAVGQFDNALWFGNPQAGRPGMGVAIDGRRPYSLIGSYTVLQATFNPVFRRLDSLDVEFEQFAFGSSAALRGRFEYDIAGLAPIPEPSTALLIFLGLGGLGYRRNSRGPHRVRS